MSISARRLSMSKTSSTGTWIGAHRFKSGDANDFNYWLQTSATQGPWTIARTFSSGLPTALPADAANYYQNGYIAWHSVKVNWAEAAAGQHDAAFVSLAQSFPTSGPAYLTLYHEPENDLDPSSGMTQANFVAMYRHVYPVVKAANPNLKFGPIYMSFQWRPGQSSTQNPDDWWMGADYCDFLAIDAYWSSWMGNPQRIDKTSGFARWYDWAGQKGKPLAHAEMGYDYQDGIDPNLRGDAIKASGEWEIAQGFEVLMYWDSDQGAGGQAGTGTTILDGDQYAIDSWQAVCADGRRLG